MIHPVAFYAFGGLAIAFSLMTILKKNPVTSAFSLVLVFFCFAGIYAALDAHLIAALQVLVYAGAIMVLFIFVIMLLAADEPSLDMKRSHPIMKAMTSFICFVLFSFFVWAIKHSQEGAPAMGIFTDENVEKLGGNSKVIAQLLFSKYILPFELTSVLLLAGIVGAVAIAKRKPGKNLQ